MKIPLFSKLFQLIGILLASASILWAQEKRTWLQVDESMPEGSPVVLEVLLADRFETVLEVSVPGLWIEETTYGEGRYMSLLLPAVQMKGKGFPAKRGDPGWWDFPAELKQPRRDPAAFQMGDGSVRKYKFPESAVGQNPTTEKEMRELGIDPEGARPGLPRLRPLVAMSRNNGPEDIDLQTETLMQRSFELPLPVVPGGFEGGDRGTEGYSPSPVVDQDFYRTFQGEYRGTEPAVGEITNFGGFSGAHLAISAITLTNPKQIKIAGRFRIYLKHLKGAEDFECPLPWDSWIFTMPFINGEALRESLTAKGLRIEASRSARYLILCPKDWRPTLENFALWKQAKGLNVDFAYVGAGEDIAADRNAIDAYLENYFRKHYCHGVYVLICGDQDVIPSGRSSRVDGDPDGSNADSDHVYEVLGNDRFPSLYVGRLSANGTEELRVQLDKILRYERNPVRGDWPTIVTLCANSQMDNGDYGVNSEWPTKYSLAVEQTASFGGYSGAPTFEKLHAGAASSSVTRAVNQDVIDALNDGRGQILYRGHGDENSWVSGWDGSGSSSSSGSAFTAASHVANLKNPVQPIVYAINCLNSRINRNDCIAERWMSLPDGGAVAHFGASVTSYTTENHERTKGIFRAIYQRGHTRLGPMLASAEAISHATIGGGGATWDSNTFCYMLLGDPEMEIRRQALPLILPDGFLTARIIKLGDSFVVRVVDDKGNAQPGAFVNLTGIDGRRFNGFANTEGDVPLEIDPEDLARLDLILDGLPFTAQYMQAPALE
nr:C25 family cysteine peptidase [Akkermansiaceae bacterium]